MKHVQSHCALRPCALLLIVYVALLSPMAAHANSTRYAATRYPIVLVPGCFGFGSVGGVLGYWFNITEALSEGGADVYLVQISALNTTEERGEQLVRQIEDIVAMSGARKVNLIGHSHGGPTARYAAAVVPDLVASVTTIASPHLGSEVADWLSADVAPPSSPVRWALAWLGNHVARLIGWLASEDMPSNAVSAMNALTHDGMARFNRRFPAGIPTRYCSDGQSTGPAGQRYYSWSGVGRRTNHWDIADPPLALVGLAFRGAPNDGLVGQCSSHFGHVIRDDYNQNHLDNVNHVFGLVDTRQVSPVELLRMHANRLKGVGL